MNKDIRNLWLSFAVLLLIVAFVLISVAGAALQEEAFLPLVAKSEDTPTPFPTPTPIPTVIVRPRLKDGSYYVSLSGDVGGTIGFRVKDNGGTAYNASFIYYWRDLPGCGARAWRFGPHQIVNGQFSYSAADLEKILARMECSSLTSTSAECTVQEFTYSGPWLGACSRPVTATVHRQN